jgi:3-deoxy-manno-octulosonate cytidylyltransferase (CMP-KDO synthetase)
MNCQVIIPARLESTRLPGKLLLDDTGKPLIAHTVEAAKKKFRNVLVATSNELIAAAVDDLVPVYITGTCYSGTERVREACKILAGDIIINWQADEPELDAQYVEDLVSACTESNEIDVATLAAPATAAECASPDVVKVVVDHDGNAMYFSRSPIPYEGQALKHMGVYAFRRESLLATSTMDPSNYPTERLEQLQWLESGMKIRVCVRPVSYAGIDTYDEYNAFVERYKIQV